jgi:hypothetical protein
MACGSSLAVVCTNGLDVDAEFDALLGRKAGIAFNDANRTGLPY